VTAIRSVTREEAGPARRAHDSVRAWPLALVGLAALGLAIGIAILDATPVGVATDDAMYVILAKALATGQGYRFLNLPGAPAATHFPPGYPALLALLWKLAPDFPANVMLFKSVNAVCLALIAVAVARFARVRLLPAGWSIAVAVLTVVSVPLLVLGTMLMSEFLFLALLLPLLPRLEAFVDRRDPGAAPAWHAAALGLAIGICLLVRTHAIVLVPVMGLLLGMRRRWRDAAVVVGVAILILAPWQIWSARHGNVLPAPLLGEYDSYLGWWLRGYRTMGPAMIPLTLQRTGVETLGMFAVLFSPSRGMIGHAATLVALAALALVGIAASWRRIPVTLLFLAGYLAIVLLWPFPSGRFVWSVWPLFMLILLAGIRAIVEAARAPARSAPRGRRALALVAAASVAWLSVGYGMYEVRAVRGAWWSSIARENTLRLVPVFQWTLANTAPGDLIAADDDGAVYLYTGRHTVPVRSFTVQQYLTNVPTRVDVEEGLAAILAAYPVRTVIVGSTSTFAAARWLAAQPAPRVFIRDTLPNGVAFTVLPR
jgi:hypothetical protein